MGVKGLCAMGYSNARRAWDGCEQIQVVYECVICVIIMQGGEVGYEKQASRGAKVRSVVRVHGACAVNMHDLGGSGDK